jgi:hypothetical protein
MTYRPYSAIISEASAGGNAVKYTLTNNFGFPISALTPVSVESTGQFRPCLPSNETQSLNIVGVTEESVLNAEEGSVIGMGRILNVSLPFALGDFVWVSKTATLTNVTPEIGVGGFDVGDFVIRIGKIVKNQDNPLQKDLIVNISLIGQL